MTGFSKDNVQRFGFRSGRGGAHLRRTLMLSELSALLAYVADPAAALTAYRVAVVDENCLNKRSGANRKQTFADLKLLYSLDPRDVLFRSLRFLWDRDVAGRPLVALLYAYARDPILCSSAPFILALRADEVLAKEDFKSFIDALEPGRFSEGTLASVVRNLGSSWTQSGHLRGRRHKVRVQPVVTCGAVAFALLLGYLQGLRGTTLFETDYLGLLGASREQLLELAEAASQRGWIVVNRIGSVVEVLFPRFLTEQEMEWLREQT